MQIITAFENSITPFENFDRFNDSYSIFLELPLLKRKLKNLLTYF